MCSRVCSRDWAGRHVLAVLAAYRYSGRQSVHDVGHGLAEPNLGFAAVAQLVEHLIRNEGVGGSSPFRGTTLILTPVQILTARPAPSPGKPSRSDRRPPPGAAWATGASPSPAPRRPPRQRGRERGSQP